MRQAQAGRIAEILAADDVAAQFEFPALVFQTADVLHHRIVHHRGHRGVDFVEHVIDLAVVDVELAPQPVVEQREVQTEIQLRFLLPFEVGVDVADRTVAGLPDAVGRPHVVGLVHAGRVTVSEAVVARDAVAQADFEVVDPPHVAQERFVRDAPASGKGPEVAPAVVRAEFRGTLAAEARAHHVAVPVRIVGAAEQREQPFARVLARVHRGTPFREVRTHAHIPRTDPIDREVVVRHVEIFAAGLPETITGNRVERMVLAENLVVVGIGFNRDPVVLTELMRRFAAAAVVDRLLVVVRNVGVLLILAFVDTHGTLQRKTFHQVDFHGRIGQQPLVLAVVRAQHDVGHGVEARSRDAVADDVVVRRIGGVAERNGRVEPESHLEDVRRVAVVALGLAELGVGADLDHSVEKVELGVDAARVVLAVVADDDAFLVLRHEGGVDLRHVRSARNAHRMALRKRKFVGKLLVPVGVVAVVLAESVLDVLA